MLQSLKDRFARFLRYQVELGSSGADIALRLEGQSELLRAIGRKIDALPAGGSTAQILGTSAATTDAPPIPAEAMEPSFSQCGEDRIVHFILRAAGVTRPVTYVDVGAANPVFHNNTFLFYKEGGSGLLIEADPDYLPEYQYYRPRDKVEQVAVVPERLGDRGTIEFFAMEDRGWSSISQDHADAARQLGKGDIRKRFQVNCDSLGAILERNMPAREFDVLSLDVEGIDAELVNEFNYEKFRPSVVILENDGSIELAADVPGAASAEVMKRNGYVMFGYTFINSIYVHRTLLAAARF